MSINRYQPHLFVLPEDDANRQLANGFQLYSRILIQRMQILPEAGGWQAVLDQFSDDHIRGLEQYEQRYVVLLLDFDSQQNRLEAALAMVPPRLKERVFVLGAWSEPEELKSTFGSYERIGSLLAKECYENTNQVWTHELLRHNSDELERLRTKVRPFLFP